MTLKANLRKTVSGKHLRVGDILLNDQPFEGCEIDSVRPHTYEGEIDHVHLTLTRRDGTKVKTTALPEDRFDIERVITADDTEPSDVAHGVNPDAIPANRIDDAGTDILATREQLVGIVDSLVDSVIAVKRQRDYSQRLINEAHAALGALAATIKRDSTHSFAVRAHLASQIYAIRDLIDGK